MITKLSLKNWRSHLDSQFDFSQGTNALIGIMGSGKTSVTDSICFSLFGTFPTLQNKKLKLDDIIMKKPVEKSQTETELQFILNGKTYSVKRIIEKGKGTTYSEIRENGKLLDAPSSQRVTEAIEKILKINYDLFSKAVYSEQNALDYFLTIPKGQRMRKIDELLMIDKFEKARANATSVANKLVDRKLGKQTIVDQIKMEGIEQDVNRAKAELARTEDEKDQLKKELERTKHEKYSVEKDLAELRKVKDSLDRLKRDENGISRIIQETQRQLESIEKTVMQFPVDEEKLAELKHRIKNLENELKDRKEEYEKCSREFSESRIKLDYLKREEIERLEKEIEEKLKIKSEYDKLNSSVGNADEALESRKRVIEKLVGEIESSRTRIKDLQEILSRLSNSEGKCPVCNTELTEQMRNELVKQKQEQLDGFKKRLVEMEKEKLINSQEARRLEEIVRELGEMLIQIKDFDKLKVDLENHRQAFESLKVLNVKLEEETIAVKLDLENLERQMKDSADEQKKFELLELQSREYEARVKRIQQLSVERQSVVDDMEKIEDKIAGKDLVELEEELNELTGKEKSVEARIEGLSQLIEERNIRISQFEQTLATVQREKEEIEKLAKTIKDLKIFASALEHTQIELRKEFVEAVNYTMNKLWPALYPYQDFTGVKLNIEEGDYVLQMQEKTGRSVNAEGVASGGERSIACLALRIAFALVLAPQMKTLILDEPTANLDSSAIRELATTLRERIGEFIEQTFIITHQQELEDAVTGSIYRLERDKSKDGVTKVVASIS